MIVLVSLASCVHENSKSSNQAGDPLLPGDRKSMNKKTLEWLMEAPFSDPNLMESKPDFSYEDWFSRGRALPGGVETLTEFLENEDLTHPSGNGMRTAYALGWIGDGRERTVNSLLRSIGSTDTALRMEAVAALGRLKATKTTSRLESLALDPDEDVNVRANACISIGLLRVESSEPKLRRLQNDSDSFVAQCATEGLRLFKDPSPVKNL